MKNWFVPEDSVYKPNTPKYKMTLTCNEYFKTNHSIFLIMHYSMVLRNEVNSARLERRFTWKSLDLPSKFSGHPCFLLTA